ncbi:MAG: hypothetical protein KF796_02290 [Ramlibacter sp.]|nr:hypothetical protein [Ramlibacter sp.]
MSTVLWANQLVNGEVVSENEDYYVLYKHGKRIDAICKELKLRPLTSFCDLTDVKFNNDESDLPPGAMSTNDVMKVSGVWIDGKEAHEVLDRVLQYVKEKSPRFGFLKNELSDVIDELEASIKFAEAAKTANAKFNFSVVQ